MNLEVNTTKISANLKKVNRGEYKATLINFNFSEEYENLKKVAVFCQNNIIYEFDIENDTCHIPYDVLKEIGSFTLGVYGYEEENEKLVLRYSPSPVSINVISGSYIQNAIPADDDSKDRYLLPKNLIAGDNIYLEKNGNDVIIYSTGGGGGGTTNYHYLNNKPKINGVELDGNKTSEELGITGTEYEAGNGIVIEENTIAVDNTVARTIAIDNLSARISAQDNRIEQQNTNISNIDTELNTFKEDYLIDMGGIVEEINNRYTKTETNSAIDTKIANELAKFDHLDYEIVEELPQTGENGVRYLVPIPNKKTCEEYIYINDDWVDIGSTEEVDLSNYYNKTEVDNKLVNKASLSIDYGDDAITVMQGTNSFTLSPTTGGYELDISGSVVTTLAKKDYVDSKVSPTEEQIIGWTRITPNTYHEVDLRTALANGKKRFTILIYMRKGENRQATKYELTITELEKLFSKVNANELVITRTIMGISNTNVVAMLKQFVKQKYDTNNQVIPGLIQIKYQGYENNAVIGTFDNFEYTVYGE